MKMLRPTRMAQDRERIDRLRQGMRESGLDAVAASLPQDVLLATGYFPIVGTSLALVTREGEVALLAPQDEAELAQATAGGEVVPFPAASLERMMTALDGIREPLRRVLRELRLERAAIGCRSGPALEPASYAAIHLYGDALPDLFSGARLRPADDFFRRMKATLTETEIDRVRRSCRLAAPAFQAGAARLQAGSKEADAAAAFRQVLYAAGIGFDGAHRADGYVACMAGVHSAAAYGAYARSRDTAIRPGDFVLTHCNSHLDGYWTDITRTYCIGPPDPRQTRMYQAVFEARRSALDIIRPGARAAAIDAAARDALRAHGFGKEFKHPAGHGVGFAAIDHNAMPRLHPKSPDSLESGMVFNLEPAVYLDGFGGLRHCDMVLVTPRGTELLTPFQAAVEQLIR